MDNYRQRTHLVKIKLQNLLGKIVARLFFMIIFKSLHIGPELSTRLTLTNVLIAVPGKSVGY